MAGRGHSGHAWRQMWDAIINRPEWLVCQVERCTQPSRAIDRSIRGRQPLAPSVDMIVPHSLGGDPLDPANLRPAHYGCNARRGNRVQVKRNWVRDDSP